MRTQVFWTLAIVIVASAFVLPLLSGVARATNPYLLWVRDYNFPEYIAASPYGKLNIVVHINKLLYDASTSADWYFYEVQVQSVPGTVAYGSSWETAQDLADHKVYSPGSVRWLADYDPTTTDGYTSSTVSASISISDRPQVNFGYSTTYTIPYIKVLDQSDYSIHKARWTHDFNEQGDPVGAPSDSTYRARPWFVVRTNQNVWSDVDAFYGIEFGTRTCPWCWPWYYTGLLTGSTRYIDAQRSGDS